MRDERGERIFNEQDLAAFRVMKKAIAGGRSTEDAAKQAVVLLNNERELRTMEGETLSENDRQLMHRMAEQIVTLTNHSEAQAQELHEVNRRLSAIMAKLNSLEAPPVEAEQTATQAASGVTEEVARKESYEEQPAKKPGLFSRLFKK